MNQVKAKFHCDTNQTAKNQWSKDWSEERIELSVVQGTTDEDKIFQSSSPGGEVKLTITNQSAKGFFQPGKKYYATFEEAPE